MNLNFKVIAGMLTIAIALTACTRPQDFGKELLTSDVVSVEFDEYFDIEAKTIIEKPLNFYVGGNLRAANRFFVGGFENDIYGKIEASGYFKLYPATQIDFSQVQIDSVKLILDYDPINYYGDTMAPQQLGVYLLEETINNDSTYTTGHTLPFDPEPIGVSDIFLPQPNTDFLSINGEDTTTLSPRVIIDLNQKFIDIFQSIPASSLIDNNLFNEIIPGFHVKSEIETDAIISFKLPSSQTSIQIFYTDQDNEKRLFNLNYLSGNAAFSHYERQSEGSLAQQYIDNPELDEYLFLQGGQGYNIEVEIPNIEELKDKTINFAILEFIVEKFDEIDYDLFPQAGRILASRYTDSGGLALLPEVAFAIQTSNFSAFGGNEINIIRDGVEYKAFRFNISNHLQNILNGEFGNKIIFNVTVSAEQFGSLAFFGNGNTLKRPVLKVAYIK